MMNKMTGEQVDAWFANRRQAGVVIDIATCEYVLGYANRCNPYGLNVEPNDDPYDEMNYCDFEYEVFVRSTDSDGWINEHDLPPEKREALHARIGAEKEAKAKAEGFPSYAAMVEAEQAKLDAEAKAKGFPNHDAMLQASIPF